MWSRITVTGRLWCPTTHRQELLDKSPDLKEPLLQHVTNSFGEQHRPHIPKLTMDVLNGIAHFQQSAENEVGAFPWFIFFDRVTCSSSDDIARSVWGRLRWLYVAVWSRPGVCRGSRRRIARSGRRRTAGARRVKINHRWSRKQKKHRPHCLFLLIIGFFSC